MSRHGAHDSDLVTPGLSHRVAASRFIIRESETQVRPNGVVAYHLCKKSRNPRLWYDGIPSADG
jgi:hypothetical protein